MAVKLVSDIHGAHEALASQLSPEDKLVMLGDYANLIDFDTLDGIISEVLSKERVARVLMRLAAGQPEEAEELAAEFTLPGGKYYARVTELMAGSYRALFDSIPCEAYALFGNNDYPELLRECAGGKARVLDGAVIRLEGKVFGFVSGSPPHKVPLVLPGDVDHATYASRVAALGPVDVLCSHVPPSGMGLEYDAVAAREEASSEALTDYIETHGPAYAFHGHVHNPGNKAATCGTTRIVNLGYFRRHKTVYDLENGFCADGAGRKGGELNGAQEGRTDT